MKRNKIILFVLFAFFIFFIVNKVSFCINLYGFNENLSMQIEKEFQNNFFILHFDKKNILNGLIGILGIFLFYLYHKYDRKNYLEKKEHGSATWGNIADIKPIIDKDERNNILFTKTEKMSRKSRKTLKNNNVLVIGGSGSRKIKVFCKT